MNFKFIELNSSLFYSEYFICTIIIYLFITYLLIINNILNILIQRIICDCLIILFLLINFLLINESLFFAINLNLSNYIIINKSLIFDYLSVIFKFILICSSFIFFIIISIILNDYKLNFFEFILFIVFNIFGLIFLGSTYNLMLIFISLELISFSSYFLVAFKKNYYYSIECGIKYLIINTVSGCFFLIGSLLIYYNLGSILIQDINLLILNLEYLFINYTTIINKNILFKVESFYYYFEFTSLKYIFFEYLFINTSFLISSNFILNFGFTLIILSIFIKLSMSPFHLWALEVYEKSVSITIFFFILLSKLGYFIILLRICYFLLNNYNFILNFFILLIILLSIFTGSLSNLIQKKIKTVLVYSSISHIGYMLLAFNINSSLSLEVFYFYLINYILSNIIIWFIILNLIKKSNNYKNKFSKNITDFIILNNTNKLIALSLLLVLLSIAGLPPFVGFFSKLGVFLVLISENLFSLILFILFFTVISIFYYIRLTKILYFENIKIGKLYEPLNSFNCFLLSFFSFILFFLFLNPKLLYLLIHILIFI